MAAEAPTVTEVAGGHEVNPEVSVVVPTRNEVENLPELHRALKQALHGVDYEVVVVDDSTDEGTRPMLHQICAGDSRWRALEREPSEQRGLGSAVSLGMALARGHAVCVMDADLQHPPATIPKLLQAVRDGADLAVASRYTAGGSAEGLANPYRRAVSRGVAGAAQAVFPEIRRTSDPLSGFFCVRREAVAGLELRPIGFKILLELLVCLPWLRVRDVPFRFGPRFSGESKATLGQGMQFGMHLLSLFVYVPLAGMLAKVAISAGAGMAVFVIAIGLVKDTPIRGDGPWLVSSVASLLVSLTAYGFVTFRTAFWRIGLGGQRLLWGGGLSAVAAGIIGFAILAGKARLATVVVALLAQAGALAAAYVLVNFVQMRDRRRMLPPSSADELSLSVLADRLGAERAWWADRSPSPASPSRSDLGLAQILEHVNRSGQPLLTIELPSCRSQARVNVESRSLMLIPQLGDRHNVVAIAVLARSGRSPFTARDLHVALDWLSRRQPPAVASALPDAPRLQNLETP